MNPHPWIPEWRRLDSPTVPPVPVSFLAPDDPDLAPPAPCPAAQLPAGCWFERLLDYLPNAYVHARASDLAQLRADGATPAEAATYARAYLAAPHVFSDTEHGRDLPQGFPVAARPVAE